MAISALPAAPNKNTDSVSTFNTKANAFVAALSTFRTEANALETNVNSKETLATAAAVTASAASATATTKASEAQASAEAAVNAPGTSATSTTSLTIGTGSKSLTIQNGKSLVAGMKVIIASTATPTTYMYGTVTSYNSGTGALVVTSEAFSGSGTLAAWTVSLTAPAVGVGLGQTWQDMSFSRDFNTNYTNTTGRPIEVAVSIYSADENPTAGGYLYVDGVQIMKILQASTLTVHSSCMSAVIPAGSVYRVTTTGSVAPLSGTLLPSGWAELR